MSELPSAFFTNVTARKAKPPTFYGSKFSFDLLPRPAQSFHPTVRSVSREGGEWADYVSEF